MRLSRVISRTCERPKGKAQDDGQAGGYSVSLHTDIPAHTEYTYICIYRWIYLSARGNKICKLKSNLPEDLQCPLALAASVAAVAASDAAAPSRGCCSSSASASASSASSFATATGATGSSAVGQLWCWCCCCDSLDPNWVASSPPSGASSSGPSSSSSSSLSSFSSSPLSSSSLGSSSPPVFSSSSFSPTVKIWQPKS